MKHEEILSELTGLKGTLSLTAHYDKNVQAAHGYIVDAIREAEEGRSIKRSLTAAGNAVSRALEDCEGNNLKLEEIGNAITDILNESD